MGFSYVNDKEEGRRKRSRRFRPGFSVDVRQRDVKRKAKGSLFTEVTEREESTGREVSRKSKKDRK